MADGHASSFCLSSASRPWIRLSRRCNRPGGPAPSSGRATAVPAPPLLLPPDAGLGPGFSSAGRTFHCGTSRLRSRCPGGNPGAGRPSPGGFPPARNGCPARRPGPTAASFQPRFTASWTPRFSPWPPAGKWTCAASPAGNTRYFSASRLSSEKRDTRRISSISTSSPKHLGPEVFRAVQPVAVAQAVQVRFAQGDQADELARAERRHHAAHRPPLRRRARRGRPEQDVRRDAVAAALDPFERQLEGLAHRAV